jgi:hypothetical protein
VEEEVVSLMDHDPFPQRPGSERRVGSSSPLVLIIEPMPLVEDCPHGVIQADECGRDPPSDGMREGRSEQTHVDLQTASTNQHREV